ncbi:two-component response regulator [Rhodoplanes sp. Z2-YC6860]|nr:response regulator [Rhodoplanes sp. Z2-YC6860]AMN45327.1 two-component response regulator [Rhodoplanes sp. Z2-YC6860]
MSEQQKVNILLVDDQPSKLLSYEVILHELGENLLKASSGREALEHLLKTEIAVVLVDVCMPDLDGFQLAAMIREHPRFQKTAMIFISAIHLTDVDRLRGYEMGAVDYVPVPVIPEVLRAKVKVFAELYRKTRQLERINAELEERVSARTAELEASTQQLRDSEERRSLALVAGNMGSWDWNEASGDCLWDDGQYRIFGVERQNFVVSAENVRALIHPDDWDGLQASMEKLFKERQPAQNEFRVKRPSGEVRWCLGTAAPSIDGSGRVVRISGVTVDITDRKQAEERQTLLAREVDHRAKNALAVVQSIVRLTRAPTIEEFTTAVEGRIRSLSLAHTILSLSRWQGADLSGLVEEELAPYRTADSSRIVASGPNVSLWPAAAQCLALAVHELVTNAAKYGALSTTTGRLTLDWSTASGNLVLRWTEKDGRPTAAPSAPGFGMRIIKASIEGQLAGATSFDWGPDGVRCELTVPLADRKLVRAPTNGHQAPQAQMPPAPRPIAVSGNRILVVEDEALVAIAIREALEEQGYSVIGPCNRVTDAMVALRHNRVDAAVLDVNLGDVSVYPLADTLAAESIPFIFVTGYGSEELDRRFLTVPILQKPIERHALQTIFTQSPRAPSRATSSPTKDALTG